MSAADDCQLSLCSLNKTRSFIHSLYPLVGTKRGRERWIETNSDIKPLQIKLSEDLFRGAEKGPNIPPPQILAKHQYCFQSNKLD